MSLEQKTNASNYPPLSVTVGSLYIGPGMYTHPTLTDYNRAVLDGIANITRQRLAAEHQPRTRKEQK